jgi:cystathionine beta-synthase
VDDWVRVSDRESFQVARNLARQEGMLVGGSSGTAVAAALRYARRLTKDDLVVVLCADTGRNYLSKFLDDKWLTENKLSSEEQATHTIADLIRTRGKRELVTVKPATSAAQAIDILESTGISQLPVVDNGKPVGSIQEVTLARILHDHSDPAKVTVGEIMAKPLPLLSVDVDLDEAYRVLLSGNTGVLAVENDEIVDIITRIDLVQYWNRMHHEGKRR